MPGGKGISDILGQARRGQKRKVRDASERLMKPLGEDCLRAWPREQRERDKTTNQGKGELDRT